MFSRVKKVSKDLNKVNTQIFLKNIGIKNKYIKNFTKENKIKLQNETDKNKILRSYLNYVNTNYIIHDSNTLEQEIEAFRLCGFTKKAAKRYVNCIQNVYKNDSTINWIYRLVEGLISCNSQKNLSSFLKQCYLNINMDSENNSSNDEDMEMDKSIISIIDCSEWFDDDEDEDDDEEYEEESSQEQV